MVGEKRETLAERLRSQGPLTPALAATVLDQVASHLAQIHEAGRERGNVRLSSIQFNASGAVVVEEASNVAGGPSPAPSDEMATLAANGATPANDQRDLAVVLVEMLTGSSDADLSAAAVQQRLDASSLPERVIDVVVRGLAPDAGDRYPSPGALAAAFRQAIDQTAENLVAGAWEAVGRGDDAMAAILYEMAGGYASDHPEFPVLAARLQGQSSLGAAVPLGSAAPVLSASGAAGLDVFASPDPKPQRPAGSPWVVFIIGATIGVIGLLAVVAVAFTYG